MSAQNPFHTLLSIIMYSIVGRTETQLCSCAPDWVPLDYSLIKNKIYKVDFDKALNYVDSNTTGHISREDTQ